MNNLIKKDKGKKKLIISLIIFGIIIGIYFLTQIDYSKFKNKSETNINVNTNHVNSNYANVTIDNLSNFIFNNNNFITNFLIISGIFALIILFIKLFWNIDNTYYI